MKTVHYISRNGRVSDLIFDDNCELDIKGKIYITSRGYLGIKIDGKRYLAHRIITGAPKGMVVDHINHNQLDNRLENLRVCTQSENQQNRIINANSRTGIPGIHPFRKGWKVQHKKKYLGTYKDIDAAIEARNSYIAKLNI